MRTLISDIESRLDEPTSKGLAAAVGRAIRDGVLSPGDRLPPIRELAHELTLSPTTVSAAWGLLTRAGTLRTAGRRGTVVADTSAPRTGRYQQALEHPTTFALDLSTGVPDASLLPGLGGALQALTTAGTPHSYLDDPVLPELHDVLLGSWPYPPPALTVVDGTMDGLELVLRTTLQYGDRVVVEHPSFPPILDLLEAVGADVVGVPLDDEGLVPDALAAALTDPVRAIVLQPRAHNPTGVSMSAARAKELGALLDRTDVLVIEDDSTSALGGADPASIGVLLPGQTVHLRSYSKSHGPDLRLAAMSGPGPLIDEIRHRRQLGQGWSSRLLQRILLHLLTDPASRGEVDHARETYAERRSAFATALALEGVETGGGDGLNAWVPVLDEAAALMRLASQGVGVAPGSPFLVLPDDPHVRVTCGLLDVADIPPVAAAVAAAARTGGWGSRAR
ncbi:aminotransferase class I/II-fold pyridoxal phosphate-dependent enzyme [Nocardioides ginsengisoli]|uniref:Aminotransferase class I/II-fold pyridoxal phosphate-dependent enzyme n=1 Tax=Nocardioides ginsengisoli TaxID=363868 RepID=A0ABW3W6B4_9ACTN